MHEPVLVTIGSHGGVGCTQRFGSNECVGRNPNPLHRQQSTRSKENSSRQGGIDKKKRKGSRERERERGAERERDKTRR